MEAKRDAFTAEAEIISAVLKVSKNIIVLLIERLIKMECYWQNLATEEKSHKNGLILPITNNLKFKNLKKRFPN